MLSIKTEEILFIKFLIRLNFITKLRIHKYKFIELIKTVGLCPTTLRFFEKNRVKLLSKRNYIAFFGNPFAIFLKPSLGGRQTPQSLRDSSPFMGAFQTRKPSLKGKVALRSNDGRVLTNDKFIFNLKYCDLSRYFTKSLGQAFRESQSMYPEENGAVADRFQSKPPECTAAAKLFTK